MNQSTIKIFITALILELTAQQGLIGVKNRFWDYPIKSNAHSTCDDFGEKDLRYKETDLLTNELFFRKDFRFGKSLMSEFINTGDIKVFDEIQKTATRFMIPHFALLIISGLCFLGTFIYMIQRVIKRAYHRLNKRKTGGNTLRAEESGGGVVKSKKSNRFYSNPFLTLVNTKRCRSLTFACNLIIGIIIIMMGWRWRYRALEMVGSLKKSDCSLSRLYSFMEYGVDTTRETATGEEIVRYYGLRGELHFFMKLKDELARMKKIPLDETNFYKYVVEMQKGLYTYLKDYKDRQILTPKGGNSMAVPTFSQDLEEFIDVFENSLFREFFRYEILNSKLDWVVQTSKKIEAEKDLYVASIVGLEDKLIEGISGIDESKKLTKRYNFTLRGPLLNAFIEISFWVFSAGVLLYIIFYCLSFKLQKAVKFSVCCQSTLTLFTMVVGIIMEIMAITAYIYSSVAVNLCSEAQTFVNRGELTKQLIPEEAHKLAEQCIFMNATGNFSNTLNKDLSQRFEDSIKLIDQESIKNLTRNINQTDHKELLIYQRGMDYGNRLSAFKTYHLNSEIFSTPSDNPDIELSKLNTLLASSQNEVQFSKEKCTKFPVSQLTDDLKYKNNEEYCLVPSSFSSRDMASRYDGVLADTSGIQSSYTQIADFSSSYDDLITQMYNTYQTKVMFNIEKSAEALLNESSSFTDMVYEKLPSSTRFYENGNYSQIGDCREIRKFVVDTVGTVCFNFVHDFDNQGSILIWLAPLVILFSCLNCIGAIGSRTKLIEADLYGIGAVYDSGIKEKSNLHSKRNIEEAPEGLGKYKGNKEKLKMNIQHSIVASRDEFIEYSLDKFDEKENDNRKSFSGIDLQFDEEEAQKEEVQKEEGQKKNSKRKDGKKNVVKRDEIEEENSRRLPPLKFKKSKKQGF